MTAGPQWVCLRAPHNSLATLGKRCLPALHWSLAPRWTPAMCTCKQVRWGEKGRWRGCGGPGFRGMRWELWACGGWSGWADVTRRGGAAESGPWFPSGKGQADALQALPLTCRHTSVLAPLSQGRSLSPHSGPSRPHTLCPSPLPLPPTLCSHAGLFAVLLTHRGVLSAPAFRLAIPSTWMLFPHATQALLPHLFQLFVQTSSSHRGLPDRLV